MPGAAPIEWGWGLEDDRSRTSATVRSAYERTRVALHIAPGDFLCSRQLLLTFDTSNGWLTSVAVVGQQRDTVVVVALSPRRAGRPVWCSLTCRVRVLLGSQGGGLVSAFVPRGSCFKPFFCSGSRSGSTPDGCSDGCLFLASVLLCMHLLV